MSGNTRKNQVTRLVTLRHRSTMSGALIPEPGQPEQRIPVKNPRPAGPLPGAGIVAAGGQHLPWAPQA